MTDEKWNPDRREVERLAYQYWEERGCEHGCHEDDWHRAEAEIRRMRGEPVPRPDRTIVAVFRSLVDAQGAFEALQNEGFTREEISFIANKSGTEGIDPSTATVTGEGGGEMAADVGIGAAIGGVGGLLLGFAALAVPGVGPVLAAGPIIAALGGAGVGAVAGGLIGALTENGIPEEEAKNYAEGVRRGDILITVHASGERADRAAAVMDDHGAININDRVSAWRKRGWKGHDSNAAPLTADELRREREYYQAAEKQGADWRQRTKSGGLTGAEAKNARQDRERTAKVYQRT